ncbi:ADP-ribosylation [Conidiobolus coronatus NRRL 28638]|uniref:Poly [ADP-ribose] polymerase n=1 Tax=Conidiobolus coronatus (strain ATCC 28846 / CBS 209.66 / NRRL 28638) TaxID=796925 RepID=A0A137NTV9_CONC2|nr:ADP-ribosylation [Conidiobolus coronatus NRRL 28638]|eukprot:KXN66190.1 ADP-ribosylation [Conidiobolus coronatus NRRL 28638]
MSDRSIHLIKFDINSGVNEYCNYQLLADAEMILVKSGRVGSEYIHDSYDGGEGKYYQLIYKKKEKGFKEIVFEEVMKDFTINTIHYISDKTSGLMIFDCDTVEKFIQEVINISGHKVKLSSFYDKIPITSCYKTPLGLMPKKVIEKANSILGEIEGLLEIYSNLDQTKLNLKKFLANNSSDEDIDSDILGKNQVSTCDEEFVAKMLIDLVNNYFNLIPTDMRFDEILNTVLESKIFTSKQKEICNLMLEYYNEIELIKSTKMPTITDNDIKMERVTDREVFDRISDLFNLTKGTYSNIKIKNIFTIKLGEQDKKFAKKSSAIGNVQSVWHGTGKRNIASILTKGLLLPENVNGNPMYGSFGSGVYFSSYSSTSISYCRELNSYSPDNKTTAYMFLACVAAGNYYEPGTIMNNFLTDGRTRYPVAGYDSTWGYKDSGSHDELVIYSEDQIRLDYVLEIENDKSTNK